MAAELMLMTGIPIKPISQDDVASADLSMVTDYIIIVNVTYIYCIT